ncbi:hypothetical protein MMC09_001125 [Bachmanniomyces sp. S44760]|nr:hypothetical protein [Bachmanniomyces sp. S44760]
MDKRGVETTSESRYAAETPVLVQLHRSSGGDVSTRINQRTITAIADNASSKIDACHQSLPEPEYLGRDCSHRDFLVDDQSPRHNASNAKGKKTVSSSSNVVQPVTSSSSTTEAGHPASDTRPIVVSSYASKMRAGRKRNPLARSSRDHSNQNSSSGLPPLSAFSFQNILAAVEPEIHESINSIAEICGRSNMSLANEYGSHLPPQGELATSVFQDRREASPVHHVLDTVEEAASSHGRQSVVDEEEISKDSVESRDARVKSTAWALLGTRTNSGCPVMSGPIARVSDVTSFACSTHGRSDIVDPNRGLNRTQDGWSSIRDTPMKRDFVSSRGFYDIAQRLRSS